MFWLIDKLNVCVNFSKCPVAGTGAFWQISLFEQDLRTAFAQRNDEEVAAAFSHAISIPCWRVYFQLCFGCALNAL